MREAKNVTILIVDDEPSLREAILFDFKRKGFIVIGAENGLQAIEIIKNQKVDLVLTDVRMPKGDGVGLLDELKILNGNQPELIFVTGFADISMEDAYNKGVRAVFVKPFARPALFSTVNKIIRDKDDWENSYSQLESKESADFKTDFNVNLNFDNLETAACNKLLNLGKGGMFVKLSEAFPEEEQKVSFNIKFQTGQIEKIEGCGIVRWVRAQNNDDLPSGCGIEFIFLQDSYRKQVVNLMHNLKTKAFIPKV